MPHRVTRRRQRQVSHVHIRHLPQVIHPASVHNKAAVRIRTRTAHALARLEREHSGIQPPLALQIENRERAAGEAAASKHDELAADLLVRGAATNDFPEQATESGSLL